MKMGNGEIILGDYRDYLPKYHDQYFQLALPDVPYGIGVGKMAYLNQNHSAKQKNGTRLKVSKTVHKKKDWDNEVPTQEYFNELVRVSKHQIIFGVEYVDWVGLGKGRIKWNKGVAEGSSFKKYELAYCSMIDAEVELNLLWAGFCQAKSLAEPMTQQGNKQLNEKRRHPCQKPILLYLRLLIDYAKQGWHILDTHGGSCNLAIACEMLGFKYTIFEIDPEYYLDGVNIVKQYLSAPKLF